MANGDVTWFDAGLSGVAGKKHNLLTAGDTIKIGIVKASALPSETTNDPRWGAGGGTDLSSQEVATGAEYAGPITLANRTGGLVGGKFVLDGDDVTINQDPSGFTDGRFVVLFNDTSPGKECLGWGDLGSNRSLQDGPLTLTWNAAGILTIDQAVE